ncbi:MIP family channel protein [Geobacter sp. FeAm09]|uniref:MIP/aquaporin family protein n=1 Tax=Geobacter sp. FeAm09 TaxID=2597769 RepID=UPI0011EBBBE7|nr:MIP family channel protein [Geobacter sp. FeAm09]QEM67456.1 MIP family channel protein [Geobacter sp. FeAm09]
MKYTHEFIGELFGTFLLVLIGCSSVAVSVLFSAHAGLFQVAMVWGLGVTLAIYATRHLSCAHLNPAVSIAMAVRRRMSWDRLPVYLCAQFLGAFIAAGLLYLLFADSIAHFESINGIVRGTPQSVKTAQMFGEFYPSPGAGPAAAVSPHAAFLAEAVGTFILVSMIFALTEGCNLGRPSDTVSPLFIGLTVTALISILAPLTQAGFNPARDLAPRIFAWMTGWGAAAFPDAGFGFITVYVLGPIAGGVAASALSYTIEPFMKAKRAAGDTCCCAGDDAAADGAQPAAE